MANYFLETQAHEWILSSQTGAYALGTGNLINQRKYNGLLIKSDNNFQRTLLVSGIEEEIEWRGEKFFLDSSHYNNCIYPEGFLHLVKSWLRPYPAFLYSSLPHNDDILIKKEIMMDEKTSTVLIKYTNLGTHKLHFRLRPKFAIRNHHYLNDAGTWDRVNVHSEFKSLDELANIIFSVQRVDSMISVFGWLQHGFGFHDQRIYRNVYYPWEAGRGFQSVEDLIAPLGFEFTLSGNETNYLCFSEYYINEPLILIENIEKRYKKLPLPADIPQKRKKQNKLEQEEVVLSALDFEDKVLYEHKDYLKILEFAMKDFIANDDIIAGFPWFGAWGRDSMISMEGLLHMPKGTEIAYKILEKYANQINNGLIPNMCGESHQAGNYVSIDATLWFILRLYEVTKKLTETQSGSKKSKTDKWKNVISITENILEEILCKPHSEFFLRADGLLELREMFASATWMDAKVHDMPVTPRSGAPVEINALLYNAIWAYEKMVDEHNELSTDKNCRLANQMYLETRTCIQAAFQKYWIGDFLADRLIGDEPIRECRPNAVIAMSLPFSSHLLSADKIAQLYETAHIELFTPYGLRTLSPKDPKFKKKYFGGSVERDKAYHQGTVWAWLLLPHAKLWLNAFPNKSSEEHANHLSYLIEKLRNGFMRGHIASVAEVWDGDKPHFPKGCPAQAWSVAALYSIENIILEQQRR